MPVGYAFLLGRETSCGSGGHRMAYSIIQAHATYLQKHCLNGCQQDIHHEDVSGHDTCLGVELVVGYSCGLRQVEHLAACAKSWHEDNGEEDYAQSTYPLRQTPPEEYPMWHALYIVQDSGTCGSEA